MGKAKPRPHTPDPIRRPRPRGMVMLFVPLLLAGCSTSWKLGPQEQEAIKSASNTGQVIGDLTGVPGGGQLGALIGAGLSTLGIGFGLYKHGKDKGWDDAVGKPPQAPSAPVDGAKS